MKLLKILFACATLVACLQVVVCLTEFDVIANLLGRSIAVLSGQKYDPDDLVPKAFSEYAMSDETNENLGHSTPQDMIARAGFNYENHYSVSDDGYVTQMVRVVNPLADQSRLKQPPVMLLQGGVTDISIWIWGSIAQHHPEKYPRVASDGPITSWNRSLAFTLANHGYDVWLISHRGANEQNRGHVNLKNKHKLPGIKFLSNEPYNETYLSSLSQEHNRRGLGDVIRYWDYSFDDIADYQVPRQIDYVLSATGSDKVTLVPMSYSSIYAPMALSRHPNYQRKIHNMVVVGPIINNKGSNRLHLVFQTSLCKVLPVELGTMFITEILLSQNMRDMNQILGQRKDFRYSVLQSLYSVLVGPSSRFQTFLETSVLGHVLMNTGFKMIKHWCQIVTNGKMKRYDHGPEANKKHYGTHFAPDYDMDILDFGNWMVVSGTNDALATVKSAKQYIGSIKPRPYRHLAVKNYNHLDLWAGTDNDVKVNLPILEFIEDNHIPPFEYQ